MATPVSSGRPTRASTARAAIAVADSSEMREFVLEHLSAQSSVASTRTSIVFDYHRNSVAASFH